MDEPVLNFQAVLEEPLKQKAVALTLDLYTDNKIQRSYLDIHALWINDKLELNHVMLCCRHFGTQAHTGDNILALTR